MSSESYVLSVHPTLAQRHKASVLALLMICSCVLIVPLADERVSRSETLVLIFDTALTVFGMVVAALLFTQFRVTRIPAALALACGFLLMSLTTAPQLLRATQEAFVDLRLQFISDLSLPAAAICFALLRRSSAPRVDASRVASIVAGGIAATVAIAALATWVTAASGDSSLSTPSGEVTLLWRVLATVVLCASLVAAVALSWRERSSVLGLWLLVTLLAWLLDVLLRAGASDYGSVSWHFARSYGVLGTACMMVALLAENAMLYSRLVRAFSGGVAAGSRRGAAAEAVRAISNELHQPLCAITANADAIRQLLERPRQDLDEVRAALDDIVGEATRASETLRSAQRMLAGANPVPVATDTDRRVLPAGADPAEADSS
jgi:hypothetical protein